MDYIFKLVDSKELALAKKGKISFSRPIFSFKGNEGFFIQFAKNMSDRFKKQGLKIKPTKNDFVEIKKWIDAYRKSYPGLNDYDLITDAMIIFCGIMNGYCGYFTNENLDNHETLLKFLKKNKLKNKIGYIRISENSFNHLHWRSNNGDFVFKKCNSDDYELKGLNGFLHQTNVDYNEKFDDYLEIFNKYNKEQTRSAKHWFTILPKKFEWQNEKRLMMLFNSLEPNSSTIGCPIKYQCGIKTLEGAIFNKMVDALYYSKKGPDYVYLCLDREDIFISKFSRF